MPESGGRPSGDSNIYSVPYPTRGTRPDWAADLRKLEESGRERGLPCHGAVASHQVIGVVGVD